MTTSNQGRYNDEESMLLTPLLLGTPLQERNWVTDIRNDGMATQLGQKP